MRMYRQIARLQFIATLWIFLFIVVTTSAQAQSLPDFTDLVKANSPAVVNISTTKKSEPGNGLPEGLRIPNMPDNEQFHEFLRKFFEQYGEDGAPGGSEMPDPSSLGSGFIVSEDGYVITNHHVVSDADQIIVNMSDRRAFSAELVGSDERSDIAVLKIDANQLPVLTLGSSENLQVGEWVLAIGSPFGFEHSVTAGIVSAKGRSLPSEQYVPFIQTDVAINPGNSGGPLFNLKGEVVGINSQIYSRTGGFMGLSFAIPIDVAMDVVQQLKESGSVTRGWLGVYIQEVTHELAESFTMDKPAGALVAQIINASPAEKAGIQVGDIILSFNGRKIKHSSDLPPLVGSVAVNEQAEVKLQRNGEEITLKVTIEALPEEGQLEAKRLGQSDNFQARLGLGFASLTDEVKESHNVSHGLLIEKVEDGPARKAGIRKGDVLVSIDRKPVNDFQQLNELIEAMEPGRSVAVLVQRDGGPEFLAIKLPGNE